MPILAFGWITHSWCRISLLLLLSMGSPLLLLLLLWLPTGSPVMPAPEHESLVALKSCLVPALCLSLLVQALTPHPESLQHKQAHNLHHILKAYNTDTQFTPHPESWQHKQAHNSHHILKAYNTDTQFTPHPESLQHNLHHILKAYNTIHTTSWKRTKQYTPHPESPQHKQAHNLHRILKDFMHITSWKTSCTPHPESVHAHILKHSCTSHPESLQDKPATIHTLSWKPSWQMGTQFMPHPERLQEKQAHNLRHILKGFRTKRHTIYVTSWKSSGQTIYATSWKPTKWTGNRITTYPKSNQANCLPKHTTWMGSVTYRVKQTGCECMQFSFHLSHLDSSLGCC